MAISIIFSFVIYRVAYIEVETRLNRFETNIQGPIIFNENSLIIKNLREQELQKAKSSLSIGLIYLNMFILMTGGFASYFLAKWHLFPIEKAHEAQSRFTSDASHELKTPLAAMKAEIEFALIDKNADINSYKEILISNLEEVDKLTKLSEMLLNLSRLDNSKLQLKPVNYSKIIKSTIKDYFNKNNQIVLKIDKQISIFANETAISDLIKILIDNAIKYSPNDSKIYVNLFKKDSCSIFEVINEGPGIKPDKIEHIFERFYRADTSRTGGETKGFGLGLSLAKNIVDIHQGEISAKSEPNVKTTFSVVIPIYKKVKTKRLAI